MDIVVQIIHASIFSDIILTTAYSHELSHYGFEVSLTNYAAAYCVGLLLARRTLKHLEIDAEYVENVQSTELNSGGSQVLSHVAPPKSSSFFADFGMDSGFQKKSSSNSSKVQVSNMTSVDDQELSYFVYKWLIRLMELSPFGFRTSCSSL